MQKRRAMAERVDEAECRGRGAAASGSALENNLIKICMSPTWLGRLR